MKKLMRYAVAIVVVCAIFVSGVLIGHFNAAEAEPEEQGLLTLVFQILAEGTPTIARAEPRADAAEVDTLLWGDRVLWDGQTEQTDTSGNRWIRVYLADGSIAWIPANFADVTAGRLKQESATYLTAGIAVGTTVTVTNTGNLANLRAEPSVSSDLLRQVQAGDVLTVIGGPYAAEYLMWWQYRDANGNTGWIIDIEDWFQPTVQ